MELEELQDGENDVVDVAEPGGLALLGVVEAARPVDGDVGVPAVELGGSADAPPRRPGRRGRGRRRRGSPRRR